MSNCSKMIRIRVLWNKQKHFAQTRHYTKQWLIPYYFGAMVKTFTYLIMMKISQLCISIKILDKKYTTYRLTDRNQNLSYTISLQSVVRSLRNIYKRQKTMLKKFVVEMKFMNQLWTVSIR